MKRSIASESVSRRTLLRTSALACSAAGFGISGTAAADPEGEITVLGNFEGDGDGWRTNGGNVLDRVGADELPGAVTMGDEALAVGVDGDPHPMIENERAVARADLVERPYLTADVFAVAESTDSDLAFTFRLHGGGGQDGRNRGNGAKNGRPGAGNSPRVVASEEEVVPQGQPRRISWDASELSEAVLESASRLSISWYPIDHPPKKGPRGRGPGHDYRGYTFFDAIQLSDSAVDLGARSVRQKLTALRLDHGRAERRIETIEDDREEGVLAYEDGTEVPYSVAVLDGGGYRYTVDGDAFVSGGGER